jgi:putative oxygen-independent coproporphyrinogen III oxidase
MSDATTASNPSTGIYIHIPFCQSKCPYCDFYSVTDLSRVPDYLNALQAEMRMTADSGTRADTLYIGGGTPSVLTPGQMGQIVDWAAAYFNLTPTAEMTLEINPATATARDLQDYAAFGFNRLNIGVQSFSDRNLSFLGRRHNADQALAAIKAGMDAGFSNIGFDLMFGLPEQTAGAWKNDLLQAIRLAPKHLSCYLLSYESHTPLHADLQAGRFMPLSDFHSADLFRMAHDFLGAAGYEHYEVSNYARGSRWRSNHNQKYWNFAPYIGLGPSAHGCCLPRRWWNHRSLDSYLEAISKGLTPRADEETLSDEQQLIEALYLGLRQFDGIDFIAFQSRFHIDFKLYFHTALDRFSAEGWLEMDNRRCRLSVEGMLFLDRIVDELVEMIN